MFAILYALSIKSIKSVFRQESKHNFILGSSISLCICLLLMKYASVNRYYHYLTTDGYVPLHLDIECITFEDSIGKGDDISRQLSESGIEMELFSHCRPIRQRHGGDNYSTVDVLFGLSRSGNKSLPPPNSMARVLKNQPNPIFQNVHEKPEPTAIDVASAAERRDDTKQMERMKSLASLISDIVMNGMPLLDIPDYLLFSDKIRKQLGVKDAPLRRGSVNESKTGGGNSNRKQSAGNQTDPYGGVYMQRYGNLLNAASGTLEIRLTPINCYTLGFKRYLEMRIPVHLQPRMKLSIKMFPNMTAAVASCCNQLWTIVEILPRINGRAISGEVFDYYTKKRGRYWIPGGSNTGQVLERVSSTVNPKLVVADWFHRCARVPQTDLVNSGFSSVNDAAGGSLYKRRVLANALFDEPNVVIRMRPSTIPDTRNYKWSPKRYIPPRTESSELLYYLSGFMSFQIEIQNYFSVIRSAGTDPAQGLYSDTFDSLFVNRSATKLDGETKHLMGSAGDIDPDDSQRGTIFPLNANGLNDGIQEFRSDLNENEQAYPDSPMIGNLQWTKDEGFISTNVFSNEVIKNTSKLYRDTNKLVNTLMMVRGNYSKNDLSSLRDILIEMPKKRQVVDVPIHNRAFPTHSLKQNAFWHSFGDMITIGFVIILSFPAAIVTGEYRREVNKGHLEMLSTLVGVTHTHSVLSWLICGVLCVFIASLISFFCFSLILDHSSAAIPSIHILLYGIAQIPLSLLVGTFIKHAEIAVIVIPTVAFVTMLPGLLYFNLAFDIQRSQAVEMIIGLIPSSALALVLKQVCLSEAMGTHAVTLFTTAHISNMPLYMHTLLLLGCCVCYTIGAVAVLNFIQLKHVFSQHQTVDSSRRSGTMSRSSSFGEFHYSSSNPVGYAVVSVLSYCISLFYCIVNVLQCASQCYCCCKRKSPASNCNTPSNSPSATSRNSSTPMSVPLASSPSAYAHLASPVKSALGSLGAGVGSFSEASYLRSPTRRESIGRVIEEEYAFDCHPNLAPMSGTHYDISSDDIELGVVHNLSRAVYGGYGSLKESPAASVGSSCEFETPLLKIEHLYKSYPSNDDAPVNILSDINTELHYNTVTCLLGSNGAGKSTLLRILCGFDADFDGHISLRQTHRGNTGDSSRRQIGWCAQQDVLFDNLTVLENVILFHTLQMNNGKEAVHRLQTSANYDTLVEERGCCDHFLGVLGCIVHYMITGAQYLLDCIAVVVIVLWYPHASVYNYDALFTLWWSGLHVHPTDVDDLLETTDKELISLDLLVHRHKYIHELSGGMKRRVCFMLAFIGNPRCVLLDEPTSGCDSYTRELIRKQIMMRKVHSAILVSTHHLDDVEIVSDNVWFINEQRLVYDGSLLELVDTGARSRGNSPAKTVARPESDVREGHNVKSMPIAKTSPEMTVAVGQFLDFVTWNSVIEAIFEDHFGVDVCREWKTVERGVHHALQAGPSTTDQTAPSSKFLNSGNKQVHSLTGHGNECISWSIPEAYFPLLLELISKLEELDNAFDGDSCVDSEQHVVSPSNNTKHLLNFSHKPNSMYSGWIVRSPSVYKCISRLFLSNSSGSCARDLETHAENIRGRAGSGHPHRHVHFDSVEFDKASSGDDSDDAMGCGHDYVGRKTRSYSLEVPHEATHLLAPGHRGYLQYPSQRKHVDKFDTLSARTEFIQTKLRTWCLNLRQNGMGHVIQILVQFKILMYIRFIESFGNSVKKVLNFICLNWLFPFVAIYLIVIFCQDIHCPPTEIRSSPSRAHSDIHRGVAGLGQMLLFDNSDSAPTPLLNSTDCVNNQGACDPYPSFFTLTNENRPQHEDDVKAGWETRSLYEISPGQLNPNVTDILLHDLPGEWNEHKNPIGATNQLHNNIRNISIHGRDSNADVSKDNGALNSPRYGPYSNDLMEKLADEYYAHGATDRWGAFVLNDFIEDYVHTSVLLGEDAMEVCVLELYIEIIGLHSKICGNKSVDDHLFGVSTSTPASVSGSQWTTEALKNLNATFASAISDNIVHSVGFCDSAPSDRDIYSHSGPHYYHVTHDSEAALRISLVKNSSRSSFNKPTSAVTNGTTYGIVVSCYQSLAANVTMSTNMTGLHAAPMYLKEIIPSLLRHSNPNRGRYSNSSLGANVYRSASSVDEHDNLVKGAKLNIDRYHLYNYPLPEASHVTPAYLERGYLGSIIVALYMFILSSSSVRVITSNRNVDAKTQLHLSGVQCATYWISNAVFDSIMVFLSLCVVLLAVYVGGSPIDKYYFGYDVNSGTEHEALAPEGLPTSGMMLIFLVCLAFSLGSVACNYMCCIFSDDPLSSQLVVLLTSIIGGLFVNLYLERQSGVVFDTAASVLTLLSPYYVFAASLSHIFNLHTVAIVNAMVHNHFIYSPHDAHVVQLIHDNMWIMVTQSIVYLFITVVLDAYWTLALKSYYDFVRCLKDSVGDMKDTWCASDTPSGHVHRGYVRIDEADEDEEPEEQSFGGNEERHHQNLNNASFIDFNNVRVVYKSRDCGVQEPNNMGNETGTALTIALNDINLSFGVGERVSIMGINGGGKSTLFRTLTDQFNHRSSVARPPYYESYNQLQAKGGHYGKKDNRTICINGKDIVHHQWDAASYSYLGYVPQEKGLLEYLTVSEAIGVFKSLHYSKVGNIVKSIDEETNDSFSSILTDKYTHYPISTLSGGNKKKLAIILSNIHNPGCLLLDEVTSGVDPVAAEHIVQLLSSSEHLRDHQGLLFSSHRIDECVATCTRAVILCGGKVFYDGSMAQFNALSAQYYQVDIILHNSGLESNEERTNELIAALSDSIYRVVKHSNVALSSLFERYIIYSPTFVKIVVRKDKIPLSVMWMCLEKLRKMTDRMRRACKSSDPTGSGNSKENEFYYSVTRFLFREMSVEDVLACIISNGTSHDAN